MKNKHCLLLIPLGIISLAPLGASTQYGQSEQNLSASLSSDVAAPTTTDQKKFSGTIVQVDRGVGALTIKTAKGEEMKFAVDTNTRINLTGSSGKLEGLKVGQQVVVWAKEDKAISIEESMTSTPLRVGTQPGRLRN